MPESQYAVEVLWNSGPPPAPKWRVSSGYCIGAGRILTAAHAVGEGTVLVRFWGGEELPATVLVHGGRQVDLAVLELAGPQAPRAPYVRIAHVDTSRATRLACQGVGYPWWKEDESTSGRPRPRGRAQLVGFVPTAEGPVGGRLTLHVEATPRDVTNGETDSIWSSVSGTVIFAGDGSGGEFAIGVVVTHRLRDGVSALTLEPFTAVERLEPDLRERFRSLLEVGPGTRTPLLHGTSYPEPVPPRRQLSVRRTLAGAVAAVVIVAGSLWWNSHRDSVADGFTEGPGINATLTGTSRPGDPTSWWVLKDPQPAPDADTKIDALAAAHEGAPMAEDTIRFTLQGNRHSGVMLTDIGARVIDRESPLAGTAYMAKSGGNAPALRIGLDLDELQPRARSYDDERRTLGGYYFDANGFSLAYRETTPVTVTVFAQRQLVRFVLVASYSVNGRLEHVEIKDRDGQPFVVSGIAARLASAYTSEPGTPGSGWSKAGTTSADFDKLTVRLAP
ncbi:hypothetical protein ACIRVF_22915 [Kitasatospora sp. NPDC101157]|uniref:hypothetical protein n=1 Tax=Kitasatospora sp. NPDC101157 TaxID=3364098 RepID=UPI0037F3CE45